MRFKILLLLFTVCTVAFADIASINGVVKLSNREPAAYAVVYIDEIKKYTTTDDAGKYTIEDVPYGKHIVQVRTIEAADYKIEVTVNQKNVSLPIALKENKAINLSEVVISGHSRERKIKAEGFAVGVVDLKKLETQSIQAADLIDRTAGVRLRQSGGMGSDIQYNINGLSGSSIRVFIDGIPIRNYGSSFSLSSIPSSMIERVEVYKGVVPGKLAEDALGGAINIILKNKARKNLSASYSFGSFNTHRADLNFNYREAKTGFSARGSAFYNYSDNNYKVWGDQIYVTDPMTGEMDYITAKRFHDSYQSFGANFDIGFTDVKWADVFTIGGLFSKMDKDIQHGATMASVYGNRTSNQSTQMINLKYEKKDIVKGLSLNAFASYSNSLRGVVDTINHRYNWSGDVYRRPNGTEITWSTTGEAGQATLSENTERMFAARANLTYEFIKNHRINAHYLFNRFTRDIDDVMLSQLERDLTETRFLNKNIIGATYDNSLFNDKLKMSAFIKHYMQSVRLSDPEKVNGVYIANDYSRSLTTDGFGGAISYSVLPTLMISVSGEKAFRLPDVTELLGNTTDNVDAAYDLKPEKSHNFNLGFIVGPFNFNDHRIGFDVNLFYRDIQDMITRAVSNSLTAETYAYENLGKVLSKGLDAEMSYSYKRMINLSANMSLFNARFNLKYDEFGTQYAYYGDRLRNAPYFTSNISAEFNKKNLFLKKSHFTFNYNFGYVHEFFRNWESLGGSGKITIPSQYVHDFGVAYTFPKNKITLSFDAKNVLNEQVFDNWALQKAGRAFYGKISYRIF